ncbi:MAG: 6-phosphofructokinase [Bacteriovoracales bacterium]|nr:6-phosphofructokinase [Bacteriovoracales bacterium]
MTAKPIKTIGVFSSGGDAPGMNAAIRSVVRTAHYEGFNVIGIYGGYKGLLDENFKSLGPRSVANIIQRGGTILKSGRFLEFHEENIRKKAVNILNHHGIDALIGIGGNGTLAGLKALHDESHFPVIGLPGTIDNDIYGTDITIGFDTAVNTALEAIDRIRDTATSHDRLFIVEVMGHSAGHLALQVGLAGGAEEIFVPETQGAIEQTIHRIEQSVRSGKLASLLVIAEGYKGGGAYDLAKMLQEKLNLEARVCILGHIQRGGTPTAFDRTLASRLGAHGIKLVKTQTFGIMAGWTAGKECSVTLDQCLKENKTLNRDTLELARILST